MAIPFLTSRVYLDADAYATIPNANAYRVSQPQITICSESDR